VSRRAFTLIELCLGMLMTAMIAGGIAAITDVTARQWNDGRQRQLLDVTVQQHRHTTGSIVRAARGLGGGGEQVQARRLLLAGRHMERCRRRRARSTRRWR
jgi:type II secretory pathway component PulJ